VRKEILKVSLIEEINKGKVHKRGPTFLAQVRLKHKKRPTLNSQIADILFLSFKNICSLGTQKSLTVVNYRYLI
jgi:hypothetical protein